MIEQPNSKTNEKIPEILPIEVGGNFLTEFILTEGNFLDQDLQLESGEGLFYLSCAVAVVPIPKSTTKHVVQQATWLEKIKEEALTMIKRIHTNHKTKIINWEN